MPFNAELDRKEELVDKMQFNAELDRKEELVNIMQFNAELVTAAHTFKQVLYCDDNILSCRAVQAALTVAALYRLWHDVRGRSAEVPSATQVTCERKCEPITSPACQQRF
jgi:hypothetical protein